MKIIITKQFQEFIHSINLSFATLLQKAAIPDLLWKEQLVLDEHQYYRLLNEFDHVVTDEQLVSLSRVENISMFMPPIYASLSASNGLQAIERLSIFKKLVGPVNISIEVVENVVKIRLSFIYPQQELPRFAVLTEQLIITSLLRMGSGNPIIPLFIGSTYEYGEQVSEFMGCSTKKAADNLLVFKKDDLEKKFITENNSMWQFLEPEMKNKLTQLNELKTFVDVIQNSLLQMIPSGHFSLNEVADSLGISSRTLQRNLQAENTNFNQQLQNVQKTLTMYFIQNKELTKTEITYLVGYTDTSSFSRAFRKWTGATFSEYRKSS